MNISPLVSIITPFYQAEKYLEETVVSLRDQSYQNWELILVDDGSTDRSFEIASQWAVKDSRIRLLQQQQKGPAIARNLGLSKAKGQFLCFLDSDDLWLPQKLELQIQFMLKTNAAFSYTYYRRFIDNPNTTGRLITAPRQVNYRKLLTENSVANLTSMINLDICGPIQLMNHPYDDFILWLNLTKKGHTGLCLPQDLARYRITPNSVSSRKGRAAKWVWSIYRNIEKLSFLKGLYYFTRYALNVSLKHLFY